MASRARRTATLELRSFSSADPSTVVPLGSAGGAAIDALVQSSRWHAIALRVRRSIEAFQLPRVGVAIDSDYFTDPKPNLKTELISAKLVADTSAAAHALNSGLSEPLGVLLRFDDRCTSAAQLTLHSYKYHQTNNYSAELL